MHDTDEHTVVTSVNESELSTAAPPSSSLDIDMTYDASHYSAAVSTSSSTLPKRNAASSSPAQPSSTSTSSTIALPPTTPHTAPPPPPHPKSRGGASSSLNTRTVHSSYSYLTPSTRLDLSSSSSPTSSPTPPPPPSRPAVPQATCAPLPSHLPPFSHSSPTAGSPVHSTAGVCTPTAGLVDSSLIPWGEVEDDSEDAFDLEDDNTLFEHLEGDCYSPHPMGDTPPLAVTPSPSLYPLFNGPAPTITRPGKGTPGKGDPAKRKAVITSNSFEALTNNAPASLSEREVTKRAKRLARLPATRAAYTRDPPLTIARSTSTPQPAAASSPPPTAPTPIPSSSTSSSSSSSPTVASQSAVTSVANLLTPSVAAIFAAAASPPPVPFTFSAGGAQAPLTTPLPPTPAPPSHTPQVSASDSAALSAPSQRPSGQGRGGGAAGRRRRRAQEDRGPPEGKEEKGNDNPASSSSPPSSSTSPSPASAPAAAHGSRQKAPTASPSARAPAPSLPGKSRAHPQSRLLDALGVPRESPTDLVATITFPANGGRNLSTLPRPAHHSGSSMVGANNTAHLLERSLHIPPPPLLKALSRYDNPADLLVHLKTMLTHQGSSLLTNLAPYITRLETAISLLKGNSMDAPAQVAEALYQTPVGMDAYCHSSYLDYFNSSTAIIKSFKTPAKEQRHVIRLGLNSPLVTAALEYHLTRYAALMCPAPTTAPSRADIAGMLPWQAEWTRRCIPTSAIHSHLQLARYEYRYETTRVSGFTRGPDCHPPLQHHDSLTEPFGSLNSFLAFLSAAAPHCYAGKVDYTPDGRAYVQLVHEMPYRSELFRLNGTTSPRHGITRPLRLTYFQQKVPAARCCSHCGEGDHQAHACPLKAASTSAAAAAEDMDSGLPVHPPDHRAGVCRDCYSPDHQRTCDTNPMSVTCKLCKQTGHTSFHCSHYRAQWVPLSLPAVTAPMSTRPLVITCIQRGLAWNTVAAASTPPPPYGPAPPPASAFPPLQPSIAARVRPAASPASPTVSSSSSAASQPPSPGSPPSAVSDDRFNQLQQVILTMQAESKAFQERQIQHFQQLQQQQWTFQQQLQIQIQGLNAQLQAQQQASRDFQSSVDSRFFALVHELAKGASPASGTLHTIHSPAPSVTAYMQAGGLQPPTTPSPAFLPTGTPATASLQPLQSMPAPPVQVSVTAQSGANASVGTLHLSLPPGANPMMGPSGPPPYAHPTQQTSSSSTPLNGLVSSPQ